MVPANISGDRKTRRNGDAETGHLGDVGTLSAKKILETAVAVSVPVSEGVHPFHSDMLISFRVGV